jgi:hypothetical protein
MGCKHAKMSHNAQGQSVFFPLRIHIAFTYQTNFQKLNVNTLHNVFIIHLMKHILILQYCSMLNFLTTLI